jgi:hypothetical protein
MCLYLPQFYSEHIKHAKFATQKLNLNFQICCFFLWRDVVNTGVDFSVTCRMGH